MISRILRNPEGKRITLKYLIVLILGIATMGYISYNINNYIKVKVINQNVLSYAYMLEGKSEGDLVKNFSREPSNEEIEKSKEILKSYGYNEEMTIASNDMLKSILKRNLVILISAIIVFVTLLYFIFIRELDKIYIEIEDIVDNTDAMSQGKYNTLEGDEKEGEMAKLIFSLNTMGNRVNNSIDLLRKDKENLKDFLSDISHQLKTPLASLVMFNDLMMENEDMSYEDRKKFLESSEEQLRRMEWLIMNLLKVGRLEANAIEFEIYKEPLKETIESAISPLIESIKNKKQKIYITGELDAEVNHDRGWLSEAISNIVKNSVEHTGEGGKIEVNVLKGPLITKIYIKDNGPGISKEMQKKVFKRFYKGENNQNPKSIGIGLSLAKSIIEEQGGEIRLISEEGKGTTFIISFFS